MGVHTSFSNPQRLASAKLCACWEGPDWQSRQSTPNYWKCDHSCGYYGIRIRVAKAGICCIQDMQLYWEVIWPLFEPVELYLPCTVRCVWGTGCSDNIADEKYKLNHLSHFEMCYYWRSRRGAWHPHSPLWYVHTLYTHSVDLPVVPSYGLVLMYNSQTKGLYFFNCAAGEEKTKLNSMASYSLNLHGSCSRCVYAGGFSPAKLGNMLCTLHVVKRTGETGEPFQVRCHLSLSVSFFHGSFNTLKRRRASH